MKPRDVIQKLKDDGWIEVGQAGSHLQLKHPAKQGKITVPMHNADLKPKTLYSIMKQAGLK
jgi:predicted RNA binding protein YcfA (HicA-like mRNA interferase family)